MNNNGAVRLRGCSDTQAGLRLCCLHATKSGFLASMPIDRKEKIIVKEHYKIDDILQNTFIQPHIYVINSF